jgi:hypothetical protein
MACVEIEHITGCIFGFETRLLLTHRMGDYLGDQIEPFVRSYHDGMEYTRNNWNKGHTRTFSFERLEIRQSRFKNNMIWQRVAGCTALESFILGVQSQNNIDMREIVILLTLHKDLSRLST